MNNLLITPKDKSSALFLKRLLKSLDKVKDIKEIKPSPAPQKADPFLALSENSLKDEWFSTEDNVWDAWAEEILLKKPK